MVKLIKSLFCINLVSKLKPSAEIEPLENETKGFRWRSLGVDPQFAVRKRLLLRGWYMLEVQLRHNCNCANASVYIDTGSGYSQELSFSVTCNSGQLVKRLLYFPEMVRSLRFDPLEEAGLFSVEHLRLVPLVPRFAHRLLAKRLAAKHLGYRGLNQQEVLARLKTDAKASYCSWLELGLAHYAETFTRRCRGRDYREWIKQVEIPRLIASQSTAPECGPLISIVLPTYNTEIELLRACIDSVLAQTYANWQLCIADDASPNSQVRDCLLEYQSRDARIHVVFRHENGHISATSNSALELAQGDYIAFLDHDDTLAPHALQRVCEAIVKSPQAQLIYSDEDKINREGYRFDPHFKPDWNPDLLLSNNYICHLTVLKADLVKKVGGLRLGVEGSQDHDLLLRCMPYLSTDSVVHIPEILYHWRAIDGSTALDGSEKSYTTEAGIAALKHYVASQGLDAEVEQGFVPNTYRVRWGVPKEKPLVSLLIPTRDRCDILQPCVDKILSLTAYDNFELLILDNQSTCKETLAYLEKIQCDSRVRVYRWDQPFNYSAINNFGARHAQGEILGLINNDIEPINSEWLTEMVGHACRPEIGCVGAKLYYPNDTIQHGGVLLGVGGVANHAHKHFGRGEHGYFARLSLVQNLSAVTGACLLVRKAIFDEVGGLDEENLAVAFNDVDLCLKVREAGYRNLWTPYAELYHHESVSRGADNTTAKRRRAQREAEYMRRRWGSLLDNDPAYNPNLTLVYEDFSLA
ncbi:glycosyltransferase family 2 protein [Microbulbifer thermotolerans]|uniref:glycosyltransferase family 2 protein n=1 Tax=Microbulbifer thermotolerans TaxID=252514 RepID=UPI002248A0FF|nr:glycosyltransferase [Microbulbifer thermotolerans]MCX2831888.1 glycosyltransferase family 2 protein [Microbulbifer thermotolerans]